MLKKITNITVAFILLISFTGFTVDLHYCKDKLYDVGILSNAKNCCDNPYDQEHTEDCEMTKDPHQCCDSENHDPKNCQRKTVNIESPSDYLISLINNFKVEPLELALSIFISANYTSELRGSGLLTQDYFQDISPPETGDVLSLLQSYLN